MVVLAERAPVKNLTPPTDWMVVALTNTHAESKSNSALDTLLEEKKVALTPEVGLRYDATNNRLVGQNLVTDQEFCFSYRETQILIILLLSVNTIVSHAHLSQLYVEMIGEIYTTDQLAATVATIRTHIKNIRSALVTLGISRDMMEAILLTRPGLGYGIRLATVDTHQTQITKIDAELKLDHGSYDLVWRGQRVPLTATEYAVLKLLIDQRGKVVNFDTFFWSVWQLPAELSETDKLGYRDNLSTLIHTLRGMRFRFSHGEVDLTIKTVPRRGYCLV